MKKQKIRVKIKLKTLWKWGEFFSYAPASATRTAGPARHLPITVLSAVRTFKHWFSQAA